jgi:hypothetical protein
MDQDLVDRIYECSLVPELWSNVLERLAQIIEAQGGALFIVHRKVTQWTASPSFREGTDRFVNQGFLERGLFTARLFGTRHAGFMIDSDILTPEEMDQEPIYRDFWRPAGLGCNADRRECPFRFEKSLRARTCGTRVCPETR